MTRTKECYECGSEIVVSDGINARDWAIFVFYTLLCVVLTASATSFLWVVL